MSFQLKVLYQNRLPTGGATTILTVPAGKAYLIKTIVLTNTSSSLASDLNLIFSGGGASGKVLEKDYSLAALACRVLTTELTLQAGDTLQASSSLTTVDCTMHGLEQTL